MLNGTRPPEKLAIVDMSQPIPLFEGNVVTDDEAGLRVHVPTRILNTPDHGDWTLDVTGQQNKFKEYDDYGTIRFLQNDKQQVAGGIWVPHVYAFETTDPLTNLPEIKDRERLAIGIYLKKVDSEDERAPRQHESGVLLKTAYGQFGANPETDRYFCYPYGHNLLFQEFVGIDTSHVYNEQIEYPDVERPSIIVYLEGVLAEGGQVALDAVLEGPVPEGYGSPEPLPHETRTIRQFESPGHFGSLQVPVTELYDPSLEAHISFDMF